MKNSFFLICCFLLLFGCSDNPVTKVPDFRLEDSQHKRFYLNQQGGEPVVIVFWATWCHACKQYLNELETVAPKWQKKGITLVSIVVDPENTDTLKNLLNTSVKISYPVLLDRDQRVMKKLKVNVFPTTVIVSQNKEAVLIKKGYSSLIMTQINNKLDILLEKNQ